MGSYKQIIAVVLCMFISLNCMASEVKTAGDLDVLQGDRVFYELLAATNKAKREANQQSDTSTVVTAPTNSTNNGSVQPTQTIIEFPQVSKIFGSAKSMKVKLSYPNGNESINKVGDVISGGYKITAITLNGVTAVQIDSGKKISLN